MKAFFKGAARLLDVFGILSRQEVEPILAKSDAEAIRSDCEAIGKDFEKIFAVDWLPMRLWGDWPISCDNGDDTETE